MISVENLYWVLYQNLLEPTGLSCWYYYPWGTKQNLSVNKEFNIFNYKHQANHVLFHFDQEPLWQDDLGDLYDKTPLAWNFQLARILANSEHSDRKRTIVKQRRMLDWYFFYHGFAALDWYRDTRYIQSDHDIKHAFISFNHITDVNRSYRLDLVARLIERNVVQHGSLSLYASVNGILQEIEDQNSLLSASSKVRIKNILCQRQDLPWILDQVPINGDLSARFGHKEYALLQSCLLHVVNETVFYQNKLHLTEKIFKPIVVKRPFVLVGAPGNLAYLKSYGFQTFDSWIDESYDTIDDHDLRLEAIAEQIEKISRLSRKQLHDLHHDMGHVLEFNKRHFFGEFRIKIVEELLENFETCVRVWNHARVDGRLLNADVDLGLVRDILLR